MFFPERLNILASDMVLEIGPWWSPFYRSDVLFDRFFDDEDAIKQSWWTGIKTKGKPLLVSSEKNLPFKNNAFDYLICSHVLEHVPVDDFVAFITEMLRVAPRGYIEFPSIFYESFFDIPEHRNIIFLKGNILYVMKKEQFGSFWTRFSGLYSSMRAILWKDKFFSRWILLNKRLFFIWAEYNQNLQVHFITNKEEIPLDIYPLIKKSIASDIFNLIYFSIKNLFCSRKQVLNTKLLQCPKCLSDMSRIENLAICNKCKNQVQIH